MFSKRTNNTQDITLQNDLDKLQAWSDEWLLRFHPEKCKVLTIGKQDYEPANLHLYCTGNNNNKTPIKLQPSQHEKDLGITIDSGLTFKDHIWNITTKANNIMGIIRRGFNFLDKDTFLPLYIHLVRSNLEYGQSVWSPYLKGDVRRIESVQRYATRQVIGLKDLPYPERLKRLELPTLVFRRQRGDMIEVYKILHKIYDEDVSPQLPLSPLTLRGHSLKLFKQRALRLNLRNNFFTLRVVDKWNSLPDQIVMSETLNQFKNRLDKH